MVNEVLIAAAERALCALDGVDDCAVISRMTRDGESEFIAYLAGPGAAGKKRIAEAVNRLVPSELRPKSLVLVSALPKDASGKTDTGRLTSLPVIDETIIAASRALLSHLPGILEAEVSVVENRIEWPLIPFPPRVNRPLSISYAGTNRVQPDVPAPGQSLIQSGMIPADAVPRNLQTMFAQTVRRSPDHTLWCFRTDDSEIALKWTDLARAAECVMGSLRSRGVKPGDAVILQCAEMDETLAAFWACHLGGFVAVPLGVPPTYAQNSAATEKLRHVWQMLDNATVITSARLAEELGAWAQNNGSADCRIENFSTLLAGAPGAKWHDSEPDDLALILFTSGSTGAPKGVTHTHRTMLSYAVGCALTHQFDSTQVQVNWFPFDHVGGIIMSHLQGAYLANTQVHAPSEMILRDPLLWLDLIHRFRATWTWAPNFAFALVCERLEETREVLDRRWDLSSMDFILNGGEAIVAHTARRFLRLLEPFGVRQNTMRPSWGMSETCSGVTYSYGIVPNLDDAPFVSVGSPILSTSFRTVSRAGEIVPEGTVGNLQVRGASITPGYFKNSQLNLESFTTDGWFETGDLAVIKGGQTTITGRSKDVIIINGANFYSHEVEAVVEQIPGVEASFTAACAVRESGDETDRLCIFFHPVSNDPDSLDGLVENIRATAIQRLGAMPAFVVPVDREEIPKTAIGKIQRLQLKARFEAGEFNDVSRRTPSAGAHEQSMPSWFHCRDWIRSEVVSDAGILAGNYLIFAEQSGLSQQLREQLNRAGATCVTVHSGDAFAETGDGYQIDPGKPAHYSQLISSLRIRGVLPDTIIHLWSYGTVGPNEPLAISQSQHSGCFSVVHLAQALPGTECLLTVVSSQAVITRSSDEAKLANGTLAGLLKSIGSSTGLACKHIDLEPNLPSESLAENAARVLKEIANQRNAPDVAYRGTARLVPSFSRASISSAIQSPLIQNGLYLITGGLGGIGTLVSSFLAREFGARIVLIGRTALPPRECWDERGLDPHMALRIRNYQSIEQATDELIYEAVDVSDVAALRNLVDKAEAKWARPLDGVFHLAGDVSAGDYWASDDQTLASESVDRFQSIFQAKVYGTMAVSKLAEDRPDAVVVLFSSVNSMFGAAGLSAYSAANSFIDLCALQMMNKRNAPTYCFNWSLWEDTGMSSGATAASRDASRALGFHSIRPAQGIASLQLALKCPAQQIVIGLDAGNPHIRKQMHGEVCGVERLSAKYVPVVNESTSAPRASVMLQDRFNTPISVSLTRVDSLLDMGGTVPAGISETTWASLSRIWQELLLLPQVRHDESFFLSGGDSLLAMRLINRVEEAFGIRLTLRAFISDPSLKGVAKAVDDELRRRSEFRIFATEQDPNALLARLDQLEDRQIELLLAEIGR